MEAPKEKEVVFVVLDFEATCDENEDNLSRQQKDERREIIEFPCVAFRLSDALEAGSMVKHNDKCVKPGSVCGVPLMEFSTFVRPTDGVEKGKTRQLSAFCTQLTSITQAQVDGADTIDVVLKRLNAWMVENNLIDADIRFVTCGNWDLQYMLPIECKRKKIQIPAYLSRGFINVKVPFEKRYGKAPGMAGMLKACNLPLAGHHHRGIDDVRNIAHLMITLLRGGSSYDLTWAKRERNEGGDNGRGRGRGRFH